MKKMCSNYAMLLTYDFRFAGKGIIFFYGTRATELDNRSRPSRWLLVVCKVQGYGRTSLAGPPS